jgi:hypothetical protein
MSGITVRNYLLFEQMLENRGELNGKRLLGSCTVEMMGANQVCYLYKSPLGDQRGQGFRITAVIMLQQFNLEVQDDFEKSIRQAIID